VKPCIFTGIRRAIFLGSLYLRSSEWARYFRTYGCYVEISSIHKAIFYASAYKHIPDAHISFLRLSPPIPFARNLRNEIKRLAYP
jgi:hypothetical protein